MHFLKPSHKKNYLLSPILFKNLVCMSVFCSCFYTFWRRRSEGWGWGVRKIVQYRPLIELYLGSDEPLNDLKAQVYNFSILGLTPLDKGVQDLTISQG